MTFPPSAAAWHGIDPDEYAGAVEEGMLRGGATAEQARQAADEAPQHPAAHDRPVLPVPHRRRRRAHPLTHPCPHRTWTGKGGTRAAPERGHGRHRDPSPTSSTASDGARGEHAQYATHRVQLRRTRGWRLPLNTVVVARPSRWGNPFAVIPGFRDRATALALYAQLVDELGEPFAAEARRHLAGRDLACWCPPGQPCHADMLLALANSAVPATMDGGDRRG